MKTITKRLLSSLSLILFLGLFSFYASAQSEEKPSPAKEATGKIGDVNVTVNYSSPAVKNRKIWGELEPYGKVWRTGANEATRIKFDKAVVVEGEQLPAGEYALFTIPEENGDWTVIFNKEAKQWSAYKYQESEDALRVKVAPEKSKALNERLKFEVKEGKKGSGEVIFAWEYVTLPISVKAAK